MPGQAVTLGPFKGGLNTLSDPSAIADNELVDCVNFEVDVDGSLKNRPPWTADPAGTPTITSRLLYLGIFVLSTGTFRIGSSLSNTVKYTGGAWSQLRASTTSTVAVQYNNKIWVVSNASANPGFSFDGTTVTDVANMPKGDVAVTYKERLFIGAGASQGVLNSTKLTWCKVSDPTDWTTTGAAGSGSRDVGLGDGEPITGIMVYNDNLIIFKTDSTWVFSYDDDPRLGTLRKISSSIGASTYGCVVQHQNALYVLHEGAVYEFINYNYSPINTKVPFVFDAAVPGGTVGVENSFLSIMGDRLICRFYNRIYVYNFITQAWTRWTTDSSFGPLVKDPADISANGYFIYYAGTYVTPTVAAYRIKDAWTTTDTESMDCSIITKVYSIAEQSRFKRLFWWGADIVSHQQITATVTPVVGSMQTYWQDVLDAGTWGDILTNTWGNPLNASLSVLSVVDLAPYASSRRFVKFYKSLRFREVYFSLDMTVDGTTPLTRLFNFVLYIAAKEKVVQQVS